jgi:hypothetical protein
MKIIITEEQYEKMKKGMDCDTQVMFQYADAITSKIGSRKVCVDEGFYNLLMDEINNKYSHHHITSGDLINKIFDYFYDANGFEAKNLKFDFVSGGSVPIARVIYQEKEIAKPKDGAKFLKCQGCRKLYTQTIHKGKKSIPVCPWCGMHKMKNNG